jgi:hypothetical protein
LKNVLLGQSLLLSCSSFLEGVQLVLKCNVLILECCELAPWRAVTWAMTCWTVGTFGSAMVKVGASGLWAKSLHEHRRDGILET